MRLPLTSAPWYSARTCRTSLCSSPASRTMRRGSRAVFDESLVKGFRELLVLLLGAPTCYLLVWCVPEARRWRDSTSAVPRIGRCAVGTGEKNPTERQASGSHSPSVRHAVRLHSR